MMRQFVGQDMGYKIAQANISASDPFIENCPTEQPNRSKSNSTSKRGTPVPVFELPIPAKRRSM